MIKQFLKAGGVKTLDEFYAKFPTEEHFNRYMAQGGMYQTGGGYDDEPVAEDYPDFRTFKAAHDQWEIMSQSPDLSDYTDSIPVQGNVPTNLVQTPNNATISAVNKFNINPYSGLSVYDFLALQGKAPGYQSRKKLAKALGINNYTGDPTQNALMLHMLQQNADILSNYENASAPLVTPDQLQKYNKTNTTDSIPTTNISKIDSTGQPTPDTAGRQIIMPDNGSFVRKKDYTKDEWSAMQKAALAAGIGITGLAGATTYAIKNPEKLEKVITTLTSKADKLDKLYKGITDPYKGMKADEILQAIKNRSFKLPTDFERLRQAGMLPKDINIGLRGMQFPEGVLKTGLANSQREQLIKNTVNAMEAARAQAATYVNRFKNAKPILEEIKQTGRTANSVAELKQAGLTTKEAMEALKGIKWTEDVSKLAKTAEAIGSGTKGVEAGVKAAEEVPALLKYLNVFKEQGGEYANGGQPCYNCGGMYNIGGQTFNPGPGTNSGPNYFPYGGSYIPQPMMMPEELPKYMYGMGMAEGGEKMPQWLAERRFAAAGNTDKMSQYGYANGGLVKGSVHDMDRNQIQDLINQGYKIEYI